MAEYATLLLAATSVGTAIDSRESRREAKNTAADQLSAQRKAEEEEKKAALLADEQAKNKAESERRKRLRELQTGGRASTFNVKPFSQTESNVSTMLGG